MLSTFTNYPFFFPILKEHLLINYEELAKVGDRYRNKTVQLSEFTVPYYGRLRLRQYLTHVSLMRMAGNDSMMVKRVEQVIYEVSIKD